MYKFNFFKDDKYNIEYVSDFISLDDKIEFFYSWIGKNIKTFTVEEINSLVDKMVLWYEFRYPNGYFDLEDVDGIMLGDMRGCNKLEWPDLFNYKKFYYMLSDKEKSFLDKPKFPNMVDLFTGSRNHFHVDDDGIINDSDDVWVRRKNPGDVMSCGIFFNGKSLRDVERINEEENLNLNIENVKRIVSSIEHRRV